MSRPAVPAFGSCGDAAVESCAPPALAIVAVCVEAPSTAWFRIAAAATVSSGAALVTGAAEAGTEVVAPSTAVGPVVPGAVPAALDVVPAVAFEGTAAVDGVSAEPVAGAAAALIGAAVVPLDGEITVDPVEGVNTDPMPDVNTEPAVAVAPVPVLPVPVVTLVLFDPVCVLP